MSEKKLEENENNRKILKRYEKLFSSTLERWEEKKMGQ